MTYPDGLVEALSRVGVSPDDLVVQPTSGRRRPVLRLTAGKVIVDLAQDPRGHHLNLLELNGRRWAEREGLPTAPLLAGDLEAGGWLVGALVPLVPATGAQYVAEALEVAARLARCAPAGGGPVATSWRAPRRTLPLRVLRLVAAGIRPLEFAAVRSAASRLPRAAVAHNDYTFRNVLLDADGGVRLVDWEYLGAGPCYGDELRLWTTLKDPADRALVLEHLLRPLSPRTRADVGLLALWLALRLHAENAAAPRVEQNALDRRHAAAMVQEARQLAARLGAWPR